MTGLREQKREHTRRLLVEVADRLFRERGYAATTVADIAAEAGVSTRTAFTYFATKDDLLFPDADERVRAAVDALEQRTDDEPITALLRALRGAEIAATDLLGDRAALRTALIESEPSVRGHALRRLADAQASIGAALHRAYPERYSAVQAAALVGAFVGAASAAAGAVSRDLADAPEDERRRALADAVGDALAPWTASRD